MNRYIDAISKEWPQRKDIALQEYSTGKCVTYQQLDCLIAYIQNYLTLHGLQKGDHIILMGNSSIQWCATFLAASLLGITIVPISPKTSQEDTECLFKHCDAKLLAYGRTSTISYSDFTNSLCIDELPIYPEIKHPTILNSIVTEEDIMMIIYTSGTTDHPKGVMLSYQSIFANLKFGLQNIPLNPGDYICTFLPLYHCYGCVYNFLFPLLARATNILIDCPLTIPNVLHVFKTYCPTIVFAVPLIVEKIAHIAASKTSSPTEYNKELHRLFGGKVRELLIGGAALKQDIENGLINAKFPLGAGYGMTELGPLISYASNAQHVNGSVGYLIDCLSHQVSDVGELMLKGETLFSGYYKDSSLTKEVIDKDGWFHTGDIVHLKKDEKGVLVYIIGRIKNMFLGPNGKNIYPEEIEHKINLLPHVNASLVLYRNQSLVALIHFESEVPEGSRKQLCVEYISRINSMLPAHMHISSIEIQQEDFFRTAKGSINRNYYNK